ncbi:hypothetical protein ACFYO1_01685 [Nocardia sp. NPDC006044]|uniref:hypothetical protein n=1 Tax=Nocardia sp. NPDC006044 TaxID=3364306 RepID=UPI003674726C
MTLRTAQKTIAGLKFSTCLVVLLCAGYAARLTDRAYASRDQRDRGEVVEKVILVALLSISALALATFIAAKVLARQSQIQ